MKYFHQNQNLIFTHKFLKNKIIQIEEIYNSEISSGILHEVAILNFLNSCLVIGFVTYKELKNKIKSYHFLKNYKCKIQPLNDMEFKSSRRIRKSFLRFN